MADAFVLPPEQLELLKEMIADHGTLRYLKSPVIDDDNCQAWLQTEYPNQNVTINEDVICAGTTLNPDSLRICVKDAGGPLVCRLGDKALLVGIASFIQPKCSAFAGYTKILNFIDWILSKLVSFFCRII